MLLARSHNTADTYYAADDRMRYSNRFTETNSLLPWWECSVCRYGVYDESVGKWTCNMSWHFSHHHPSNARHGLLSFFVFSLFRRRCRHRIVFWMHWIRDAISHHQIIGLMCAIAHRMRAPEYCTHSHTQTQTHIVFEIDGSVWLLAPKHTARCAAMSNFRPNAHTQTKEISHFSFAALLFRFELWASSAVTAMHWRSQYRQWWWWYSCHSMALLRVSTKKTQHIKTTNNENAVDAAYDKQKQNHQMSTYVHIMCCILCVQMARAIDTHKSRNTRTVTLDCVDCVEGETYTMHTHVGSRLARSLAVC